MSFPFSPFQISKYEHLSSPDAFLGDQANTSSMCCLNFFHASSTLLEFQLITGFGRFEAIVKFGIDTCWCGGVPFRAFFREGELNDETLFWSDTHLGLDLKVKSRSSPRQWVYIPLLTPCYALFVLWTMDLTKVTEGLYFLACLYLFRKTELALPHCIIEYVHRSDILCDTITVRVQYTTGLYLFELNK